MQLFPYFTNIKPHVGQPVFVKIGKNKWKWGKNKEYVVIGYIKQIEIYEL